MAESVSITQHFTVTIDGVTYAGGSTTAPVTHALTSDIIKDVTVNMATTTSYTFYDEDNAPDATVFTTFVFLYVMSDKDVVLKLYDESATAHEVPVKADVPLIIASEIVDTAETIDKVEIENVHADTAVVRVVIAG